MHHLEPYPNLEHNIKLGGGKMKRVYWYNQWHNYWYNLLNNSWITNFITIEMAITIALQYIQGQVIKVELDTEDGILVYEVYIRNPYGIYEVKIDANTGMVLEIEQE